MSLRTAAFEVRRSWVTLVLVLASVSSAYWARGATPEPNPHVPSVSFQVPLPGRRSTAAPAQVTASYSPARCRAELRRRSIAVQPASAPGVALPVRLAGPLQGVRFVTPGRRSVYGVLDCRLVLALDDFARVLARYYVVEVLVDNMYRPRARLPGRKGKKSQHAYGLAADITGLKLADGRVLLVEQAWQGFVGTPSCGPEARLATTSEATLILRNLICEVARAKLFNHMLTPNHDAAHRNHLHLDIKRGAREVGID